MIPSFASWRGTNSTKDRNTSSEPKSSEELLVGLDCGRKLLRCSIVSEDAFGGYGLGVGSTDWEPSCSK